MDFRVRARGEDWRVIGSKTTDGWVVCGGPFPTVVFLSPALLPAPTGMAPHLHTLYKWKRKRKRKRNPLLSCLSQLLCFCPFLHFFPLFFLPKPHHSSFSIFFLPLLLSIVFSSKSSLYSFIQLPSPLCFLVGLYKDYDFLACFCIGFHFLTYPHTVFSFFFSFSVWVCLEFWSTFVCHYFLFFTVQLTIFIPLILYLEFYVFVHESCANSHFVLSSLLLHSSSASFPLFLISLALSLYGYNPVMHLVSGF